LIVHKEEVAVMQAIERKTTEEETENAEHGGFIRESNSLSETKLNAILKQLLGRDTDDTDVVYEARVAGDLGAAGLVPGPSLEPTGNPPGTGPAETGRLPVGSRVVPANAWRAPVTNIYRAGSR
jgi:hypothetical protein